jgi:hypothetical protein
MIFLEFVELTIAVLFAVFVLTQVVIPLFAGRPIFPLFNKKQREVDQELAEVKEEYDLAKKKKEIFLLVQQLEDATKEYETELLKRKSEV